MPDSSISFLLFLVVFSFPLLLQRAATSVDRLQHNETQISKIDVRGEAETSYNVECRCYLPPPPPPPPPKCAPPPPPKCAPPLPPPPPPYVDPVLQKNIRVIQKFKKRITGDPKGITKTWIGNGLCVENSNTYQGFFCYNPTGSQKKRVGGIYFNEFNFGGKDLSLNDFIESFNDLVVIHINSNGFQGRVPTEISVSNLPTLFELDLSNNKLSGAFPETVLEATNLTFLDLRFNTLSGLVPDRVFTLDLDALFLNNNRFSGSIPENLGTSSVFFLTLANNEFTGPIPKSIGGLENLREVLFLNNMLSGCLPYEIGLLGNATVFDASTNKLTGPIPESFGCLGKLEILNLTNNKLFGPVPESLCKLKHLEELSLSNNYFIEIGPECRQLLEKKVLDIDNNCILDLPNQKSATECFKFYMQHRECPDPISMFYIPCEINVSPQKENTNSRPQKLKRTTSTTYVALNPNRP